MCGVAERPMVFDGSICVRTGVINSKPMKPMEISWLCFEALITNRF